MLTDVGEILTGFDLVHTCSTQKYKRSIRCKSVTHNYQKFIFCKSATQKYRITKQFLTHNYRMDPPPPYVNFQVIPLGLALETKHCMYSQSGAESVHLQVTF